MVSSIRPFYKGWETYNRRLTDVIREMSPEQLAIRPAPERAPVWATVAHTAAARVYWLSGVFGEPGAETTPLSEFANGIGWEDDESHPRTADELVAVLEASWAIVDRCLDRWTPEMLEETFTRDYAGRQQLHTRQSVLMRLLTHDAYHCGELSQTFGIHKLPQIDLWAPQEMLARAET